MFFFFIGGVQPKTVQLDKNPRTCPICGLSGAFLKRVDHWITIFFIPLFRIKKGEPFLECPRCGPVFKEEVASERREIIPICPACGRQLSPEYKFCPFCGKKL